MSPTKTPSPRLRISRAIAQNTINREADKGDDLIAGLNYVAYHGDAVSEWIAGAALVLRRFFDLDSVSNDFEGAGGAFSPAMLEISGRKGIIGLLERKVSYLRSLCTRIERGGFPAHPNVPRLTQPICS